MNGEVLALLWDATLASSLAIALVVLVRPHLRRHFGAELGYASWLAVPIAGVAALLPILPGAPELATTIPTLPALVVAASGRAGGGDWNGVLLAGWILGALAATMVFVRQQRRFVRGLRLGDIAMWRDRIPVLRARSEGAGPAAIGAWHPVIVIPHDFETRYAAAERELVLAHEAMHVARRDGFANAVLALVRCVFWFNPLVHVGAARFRFDQELACDAAVLRRYPGHRRTYAEAMLKTQLAVPGLPVGCHWQSSQPLKERIIMLKAGQVSPARRRTGAGVVAVLLGVLALSSYAAQSSPGATAPKATAVASPVGYASIKRIAYPAAALAAREHGIVYARIHVGSDGHVLGAVPDPESTQPAKILQDAVIAGVMDWRFEPARRDGVAVESFVVVPVTFSLEGDPDPAVPEAEGVLDAIQIRAGPEQR